MARHRNVRAMNYDDEYDGYDDELGHSVENDFCISPGTVAQFTFNRSDQHHLASFVEPSIIEEDEREDEDVDMHEHSSNSSDLATIGLSQRQRLNDVENAQLNSCLEMMSSIIGESATESDMIDAVLACNYDSEKAINLVLNQLDAPKPQRTPRIRASQAESSSFEATPSIQIPSRTPSAATPINVKQIRFTGRASQQPSANTNVKNSDPPAYTGSANKQSAAGVDKQRTKFTIGPELTPCSASSVSTPTVVPSGNKKPTNEKSKEVSSKSNGGSKEAGKQDPAVAGWNEYTDLGGDSIETNASGMCTPRREGLEGGVSGLIVTPSLHKSSSKSRIDRLDVQKEYELRKAGGKDFINLVVIGHVDAGKSTLMGHLLYQLGFVNKRTMHKYEQDSRKIGKGSFAFAWILDETEEERSRGVTMDIAQTRFETKTKVVTLLDAPGHKDFIPNMITGAAQADVAVLVVNASNGEFETGFELGGQTREHAVLARSLGVSQLLIAVNKMDMVGWSRDRYDEIVGKLRVFLKQAGFRDADTVYVPCSGLSGENLNTPPTEERLTAWYTGPTLVEQIDCFRPPERPVTDKPLRMCITDVFKGQGAGFSVAGTVQTGNIQAGDRVLVIPAAETGFVKSVSVDDSAVGVGFAGDNVIVTLTGIEVANVNTGSVLCDPLNPVETATRIRARIIIFNVNVLITKSFQIILHYQSLSEHGHIRRLVSQLHRNTGEVIKKNPRFLVKNTSAIVDIELDRPISIERYKDYKDLGRFMLRSEGTTIAAGMVIEILSSKQKTQDSADV